MSMFNRYVPLPEGIGYRMIDSFCNRLLYLGTPNFLAGGGYTIHAAEPMENPWFIVSWASVGCATAHWFIGHRFAQQQRLEQKGSASLADNLERNIQKQTCWTNHQRICPKTAWWRRWVNQLWTPSKGYLVLDISKVFCTPEGFSLHDGNSMLRSQKTCQLGQCTKRESNLVSRLPVMAIE